MSGGSSGGNDQGSVMPQAMNKLMAGRGGFPMAGMPPWMGGIPNPQIQQPQMPQAQPLSGGPYNQMTQGLAAPMQPQPGGMMGGMPNWNAMTQGLAAPGLGMPSQQATPGRFNRPTQRPIMPWMGGPMRGV